MWKQKNIDLGEVKVGKEIIINFEYLGDITVNKNRWGKDDITVSCGCTSAVFNSKDKVLKVRFTPNPIPTHLKQEGKVSYSSQKSITINYKDADGKDIIDRLVFTAIVKP